MTDDKNIQWAKIEIEKLIHIKEDKLSTMLATASIITTLMEPIHRKDAYPIVVGGLAVEIYTQGDYTTRDIDFVTSSSIALREILPKIGFKREGRIYYHEAIEIVIDVVDNALEGSYEKLVMLQLDQERYVYVISMEDIILDRLRGFENSDSNEWGLRLLASNFDSVDLEYIKAEAVGPEKAELERWLTVINNPNIE